MAGASASQEPINRFSRSEIAPDGEWFYEFSVGLALQSEQELSVGDRRIDGVCVTSREHTDPKWLSRAETRDRRDSGWLDGEDVVIVEHGIGPGAWAKYGQMDIRRRMFEMDWPDTNVKGATLLMEKTDPSGNEDTQWIFENELDGCKYVVEYEGVYYEYGEFINEVC